MSVEYAKSGAAGDAMRGHGGAERYRLVLVVGVLLVVMTAAIVGVTVWVVTQQTGGGEPAPRRAADTAVSYVGWEEAPPPPESDAHILTGDRRAEATDEPTTTESGAAAMDGAQIQASLANLGPNRQLQLEQMQAGDYSQNVADVMKQLQQQQQQQLQQQQQQQQQQGHDQLGEQRQQGIRQGGTIQSYGVLETYQHDMPPGWPPAADNPNRVGQSFEGVAQPYDSAYGASGSGGGGGGWSDPGRPQSHRRGQTQDHGMYRPEQRPGERQGERLGELASGGRGGPGGPGMGLRPFPGESERPSFARRGDQERPRRPPFRSREAVNRTYSAGDPATNAGLDLAVSGWSAFSFGMFLLKKMVHIMGYGRQSRVVPDETSMFLRALDVAGKIVGFDASEELAVLGDGLSEARSFPEATDDADEPEMSRLDLVNGLFRVGLNMVNLFTSEGELNVSECLWGAYCEDLQRRSVDGSVDGIVAKVNSIGLKLIRGDVQEYIGVGQMMSMVQQFEGSQCQKLFPDCHGRAAVGFMGDLFGVA